MFRLKERNKINQLVVWNKTDLHNSSSYKNKTQLRYSAKNNNIFQETENETRKSALQEITVN